MKKKSFGYLFISLFIGLLIISCLSLMIGTPILSPAEVLSVLTGNGDSFTELLVIDFRMPRLFISILAGACLGVSGYLLQGVTRNELADSSVLGINAGAGLFVMVYIGFFSQNTMAMLLPLVACLGGCFSATCVYFISRKKRVIGMNRLLLSGIAMNAGLSALTLLLTIKLSKESYSFVNSWLAGSIWGTSWLNVLALLPWAMILLPVAYIMSRYLPVLSFGEERARSLGVHVSRIQQFILFTAVVLACSSIAMAGSLSFVGLVAPHMAKNIVKKENGYAFGLTILFGALLVNCADVIARVLLPSGELPTGIIIAIIGAPYFLYLLFSRQKKL